MVDATSVVLVVAFCFFFADPHPLSTARLNTAIKRPIATKKDEQKAAVKATVTYNGFSDTNSVEMKMSDGSYEVMIVEKEDLIKKLEDLNPGTKVTIRYKAKAGQANKQIIAVF